MFTLIGTGIVEDDNDTKKDLFSKDLFLKSKIKCYQYYSTKTDNSSPPLGVIERRVKGEKNDEITASEYSDNKRRRENTISSEKKTTDQQLNI